MATVSTISSFQMSMNNRLTIASLNAQLQKANEEVATGFKSNVYAELGANAAKSLVLRQQMQLADNYVTSNALISGRMSTMDDALSAVRTSAQEVLSLAVPNAQAATQTAGELQQMAISAYNSIVASLNATYAGSSLFSGTATDVSTMQGWSGTSATTGVSPETAVSAITGGTLTNAADAASKISQLQQAFASGTGTTSDYEGTFYNGTPASNGARLTARIAEGVTINYGVQANDPAITETLRGLAMLATTDVSQITDSAAYSAWVSEAVSALSSGVDGIDDARADLGSKMNVIEAQSSRQQTLSDLYNNRIVDLEGVDAYEAAVRVTALQNQLEATYSVTAQITQMSILDFL